MARYITFPLEISPQTLLQRAYDFLRARMPGWNQNSGALDVWLLQSVSSELSELLDVSSRVPDIIFRYLGKSILGIQPIEASSASGNTTWTMIDAAGHTIPVFTQIGIRDAAGQLVPFLTINEVVVPPGSTTTSIGEVGIVALNPGADSSNLGTVGGPVELIDILFFVDSIALVSPTSGGQDGETDADYMNRLTTDMRLLAKRPILPQDFADLARDIAGVARATALDGYNPTDDTFDNERMVTVAAVDGDGEDVSGATKTAIQTYLDSLRELNFVVNTMSPTYNEIDTTAAVGVLDGWAPADVIANVESTLDQYYNPANWGLDVHGPDAVGDTSAWVNQNVVRLYDVVHVIKGVDGVAYIDGDVTLGKDGAAQAAADVTLDGRISMTRPGTATITTV